MTPARLKTLVSATGSHFFTRGTLKFFGDTMHNYGVRRKPIKLHARDGTVREVWVLYRKHAVKHGLSSDAYFDIHTLEMVSP